MGATRRTTKQTGELLWWLLLAESPSHRKTASSTSSSVSVCSALGHRSDLSHGLSHETPNHRADGARRPNTTPYETPYRTRLLSIRAHSPDAFGRIPKPCVACSSHAGGTNN